MVPKYEWSAMSVCVSVCVYKTGPEDDHWSTRQRHKGNLHAVFTQCIVYSKYLHNGQTRVLRPKRSQVAANPTIRSTTSSIIARDGRILKISIRNLISGFAHESAFTRRDLCPQITWLYRYVIPAAL